MAALYSPYVTSFLVLAVAGLVNALYLLYKHYQKKPLLCPLDHKCEVVTESRWSHIFGVRNEAIGVIFFSLLILSVLSVIFFAAYVSLLIFFIQVSCALSLFFSLFLVFVQFRIIKDYCFYCLLSTLIVLLLFINSWGL